jgi:hypothetical protein
MANFQMDLPVKIVVHLANLVAVQQLIALLAEQTNFWMVQHVLIIVLQINTLTDSIVNLVIKHAKLARAQPLMNV